MKIVTPKGQLDLPEDFNITIKRTNPILSDAGDCSIPVSLPATPRNLAVIGHRERIDRASRYDNKVDAILTVGPVQKRGQLLIDTVGRHEGIEAVFAIDNSDLYVTNKGKGLKDILRSFNGNEGYIQEFNSVSAACAYMEEIYRGAHTDADYVIFPVAVSPYEEEDPYGGDPTKVYQYNNEVKTGNLVYNGRYVHEGDIDQMWVPEGYGVAPFLKLHRMVDILFHCIGLEVTENCLDSAPFEKIAVVHNCSDCLVQDTLHYEDLVPNMTLGDFMEWLNNKFHVQPVVDSEAKTVRIVSFESMIDSKLVDRDLSGSLIDDFKVSLHPSKRVVLVPTTTIEGSEPAARSFDELLKKFSYHQAVNEVEFAGLTGNTPAYEECLVLRKATGQMYVAKHKSYNTPQIVELLGTNYFAYDRENSDETEEFSQEDSMPPMIINRYCGVMPFIGERKHAHTNYEGSAYDKDQGLMVVQFFTSEDLFFCTSGTTQRYLYYPDGVNCIDLGFDMTSYGLYGQCWQKYNDILLNNQVKLSGRIQLKITDILKLDLAKLKLFDNQLLLPESLSGSLSTMVGQAEADFILIKNFIDMINDQPILPGGGGGGTVVYKWEITSDETTVANALGYYLQTHWQPELPEGQHFDGCSYFGYEIEYYGSMPDPGAPTYEGETKVFTRNAKITIIMRYVYYYYQTDPSTGTTYTMTGTGTRYLENDNQTVTVTYTAVVA